MSTWWMLALVVMVVSPPQEREGTFTTAEAARHVGERATVCGLVASTYFAQSSPGQPTFLNLDEPHPDPVFTVVIFGRDRVRFGSPERTYRRARICVTGTIESYRGVPQIIASDPSQISDDAGGAAAWSYDRFMTELDASSRRTTFTTLLPDRQSALMTTHLRRCLEAYRERLSPAQTAAIEASIESLTPAFYANPTSEASVRQAKRLQALIAEAGFSGDDRTQIFTITGTRVPSP